MIRAMMTGGWIAAMLALPIGSAHGASAEPAMTPLAFTILKSGGEIGSYRLDFSRDGGALIVDVDIDLRVRFAFVTIYRYQHRAREVWHDGRFVAIDAWTYDKGREFNVSARVQDERTRIDGPTGRIAAPNAIIPKSYWNRRILDEKRVFDTQFGSLLDLVVDDKGAENVDVRGGLTPARRYRVRGYEVKDEVRQRDPWVDVEVWYDEGDRLVRMSFSYLGFDFLYVPR